MTNYIHVLHMRAMYKLIGGVGVPNIVFKEIFLNLDSVLEKDFWTPLRPPPTLYLKMYIFVVFHGEARTLSVPNATTSTG